MCAVVYDLCRITENFTTFSCKLFLPLIDSSICNAIANEKERQMKKKKLNARVMKRGKNVMVMMLIIIQSLAFT